MSLTRAVPLALLVSACALGGDDGSSISQAISGTASINVNSSSVAVTLTSDAQWSLTKTGSVSGNTVTWNVTATKTATVSGQLVVQGHLNVTNSGSGPATLGNIVVNLQTRVSNTWKSASADVANGTLGDAATTAKIHAAASSENKSSFTENAASGKLEFMDATNNTVFSLIPEVTINAGQTRSLLFQATFDNNVLHLATGTPIRAEVIVSFGNATATGNSTPNVDINGNGLIDWDEKRVRSVPTRLSVTVPPTTNGNTTPTLKDTASDIIGEGVTVGSTWFNLGPTGGTVVAQVSGVGTVTNCAHLTSPGQTVTSGGFTFQQVGAINLQACNTQTVSAPPACTHGTPNCAWASNDFRIFTQTSWEGNGKSTLEASYDNVYASTFGTLTIGTTGGPTASWTSVQAIENYLPQAGSPAPLDSTSVDATSTSSHAFGGEAVALSLNIAFSDANVTPHYQTLAFGDVRVCGTSTAADGQTVRGVLALTNSLLSFGPQPSIDALYPVLLQLNASFDNGTVSTWAQEHLVNGACP
ncbi:MAG TPA: hypothetical protein VMZ53_06075 [Kofleriaceae bacterium]|nr:hypothetical protein [Kofleriaceae bacterium]